MIKMLLLAVDHPPPTRKQLKGIPLWTACVTCVPSGALWSSLAWPRIQISPDAATRHEAQRRRQGSQEPGTTVSQVSHPDELHLLSNPDGPTGQPPATYMHGTAAVTATWLPWPGPACFLTTPGCGAGPHRHLPLWLSLPSHVLSDIHSHRDSPSVPRPSHTPGPGHLERRTSDHPPPSSSSTRAL